MKPVYLIVLMEESSKNFIDVSPKYIHHVHYVCDTSAQINFLANYTYISLDTFHSISQNIDSYLDAWFTFLSSDSPNDILKLINLYPEFLEYYHDVAEFRKNPKELITMYSEVLAQIDRNTELLMIEEMKQEVEQLRLEREQANSELDKANSELDKISSDLAQRLYANGISFEIARDSIPNLSDEKLKAIYNISN